MNNKKIFRYILLAGSALLFCFFACTERIDISTEASPPRLVIYGYITTDTTQHAIRITRSTGYFVSTKPEGISQASVRISCDDGVFQLKESSEEQGLYLTSPDIYGIAGKTYTLHVSIDIDDKEITGEFEAMSYLPFPATLDSTIVTPSPFLDDHLQVLIWGNLPEESSGYFSFHFFRNGVVINDSLRRFQIEQDDYLISKKITALPVYYLNQERDRSKLSAGDTLTVQVESITSEYASFLWNAIQEMRGPVPLFGGPPANIETNINCLSPASKTGVSGFFTAYSKHRTFTVCE